VVRPGATPAAAMVLASPGMLAIGFAATTQAQELIRSTLEGRRSGPGEAGPGAGAGSAGPPGGQGSGDTVGAGAGAASAAVAAARREAVEKAKAGELPTFIACQDAAATLYALQLVRPFEKLKPVWVLGAESYRIVDLLGSRKQDVVLPAEVALEPLTRNRMNVPAMLHRAGAKVACRPPADGVDGFAALRFRMGELVRSGLPRDIALKAITLHPAEMLGLAARASAASRPAATPTCYC
jgi:hypothetical protein